MELDSVHGHDAPQKLVRPSSACAGSNREPHRAWLSHVANQDIYSLGKQLASLSSLSAEQTISSQVFNLWFARHGLQAMILPSAPFLSSSQRAAKRLIERIDQILPNEMREAMEIDNDMKFEWHATGISNTLSELESVMQNEMPDVAAYVVSQKGIFRTDDLIERAERQLTTSSISMLPQAALKDVQDAGRCLAFELPTACAFHLWRAVETCISLYFESLTTKTFEAQKVPRNWGAYIKALEQAGADKKITAFLDHIRSEYRNPHTHPDETIDNNEALRLFSVALGSIEQMLLACAKPRLSAPVPTTTGSGGSLGALTALSGQATTSPGTPSSP